MSTDKQVYPLYYEAKNDKVRKRLGIKGGFYWAEAKKLSIAISRGAVAIDDAGYDEDDFKKPVRVNLPVVDDLPPEGVFDTEFCCLIRNSATVTKKAGKMASQWYLSHLLPLFRTNQPALTIPTSTAKT